jgi:hypothetical protein
MKIITIANENYHALQRITLGRSSCAGSAIGITRTHSARKLIHTLPSTLQVLLPQRDFPIPAAHSENVACEAP